MKYLLTLTVAFFASQSAIAQQCYCEKYPFKPEGCFAECVKNLMVKSSSDIDRVQNLDPGVSVSLRILSQNHSADKPEMSFVKDKADLENAALSVMRHSDSKLEIQR